MRIRIELIDGLEENEVLIRCARVDQSIERLQRLIADHVPASPALVFFQDQQEFFFPLEHVLFFQTEAQLVYAHTPDSAYRIKHKLYELQSLLPTSFIRISKSTIVNAAKVYSIQRDLTASSRVEFAGTHKHVYASRQYVQALRQHLYDIR